MWLRNPAPADKNSVWFSGYFLWLVKNQKKKTTLKRGSKKNFTCQIKILLPQGFKIILNTLKNLPALNHKMSIPKKHILCSSAHWKHRPIWKTIVLDISGGAFASPSLETCALQTRTICPEWLYLSKMRNRGVLEPTGMLVPSGQVQSYVFILKASEIPLSMHREESEAFLGRA